MAKYKVACFSATKYEIASEVKDISGPQEVKEFLGKYSVTWLDCTAASDAEIAAVGEIFGFHRLCLEDCSKLPQRPKVNDYGDYFFMVIREVEYHKEVHSHQISMFVGKNYVVTLREKHDKLFDPLFDRIAQKSPRLQDKGSDYLCYAITDQIINGYAPILDVIEDEIEIVEKEILGKTSKETLGRIFKLKKDLLILRKIIIPTREMLLFFEREDLPNMTDKSRIYFRDVYDNIVGSMELIDTYRELTSGIIESYLSTLSNSINSVVKVLTVLASLALVPTMIASIYGMNVDFPETDILGGRNTYYLAICLMLVSTVVMIYYFRKREWL
jgi:magnesium transporter